MSRVVPGMSLTIERSSCSNRLSSEDLPTFGRPTMATATSGGSSGADALAAGREHARRPRRAGRPSLAVLGGDLDHWLEAELVELDRPAARPAVVGLVDRHEHRRLRGSEAAGNLLVARHEPSRPSTTNTIRSAVSIAFRPCSHDELVQGIVAGAEHAAGVDERERRAQPLGRLRVRVSGRPGYRRDDRAAHAGDAVEEGGLADVRTADQHDRRAGSRSVSWAMSNR